MTNKLNENVVYLHDSSPAEELEDAATSPVYDAVANISAFDKRDANALADYCLDIVIDGLRRCASPTRTSDEWSLLLADRRADLVEMLTEMLDGKIDREEALNTIIVTQ